MGCFRCSGEPEKLRKNNNDDNQYRRADHASPNRGKIFIDLFFFFFDNLFTCKNLLSVILLRSFDEIHIFCFGEEEEVKILFIVHEE